MEYLFINIKSLLQVRKPEDEILKGKNMSNLPKIDMAFLHIKEDKIIDYGSMSSTPDTIAAEVIDCSGKFILPTWVDSHTHLVYSGHREDEFADRIDGLSYEDIAQKGGGILNSAKKTQTTSFEKLYDETEVRLKEIMQLGTGAVEIKSGYGLSVDAELKMLKVIQTLKDNYTLPIKATFLAAHGVPKEYKDQKKAYVAMVIDTILPKVAEQSLADYIDVFCEKGYFDLEDTERLIKAGQKHNLKAKIHVNQFNSFGGVKLASELGALTVDHLEELTEDDILTLKKGTTIPVALPGCSFFLEIPYTQGRRLIDNNLPLVLASDFNPGSSPSGNMNFIVALACIKMKLTPEEAINAATFNASFALDLQDKIGSITRGKLANFIITKKIPSYRTLPYAFGSNCIESVWISGHLIS
jgi:imidazolonepropionase